MTDDEFESRVDTILERGAIACLTFGVLCFAWVIACQLLRVIERM